ncbi:M48 family peptidase, partial [Burkholderia sp. Se-20378]|nr:M48 family peptidase [Burkholderia sp. Se-20378]
MTRIFRPNAAMRAGRAGRRRFHPAMRVKQLLAVSLSVALALPPSGHAQSASAPPLEAGAGGARAMSTVQSGIAAGVFGTY